MVPKHGVQGCAVVKDVVASNNRYNHAITLGLLLRLRVLVRIGLIVLVFGSLLTVECDTIDNQCNDAAERGRIAKERRVVIMMRSSQPFPWSSTSPLRRTA